MDGNRLFSRPVLIAHLQEISPPPGGGTPIELILMINHWKSKTEDTQENRFTLPRRLEEAEFVAELVDDLSRQFPAASIIVAGDLNDVPGSDPLLQVKAPWMLDLTEWVEKPSRYSLIYRGISQVFDYILVKPARYLNASHAAFQHINSDYPADFENDAVTDQRSSDHDPLVVHFVSFSRFSFLPVIYHGAVKVADRIMGHLSIFSIRFPDVG